MICGFSISSSYGSSSDILADTLAVLHSCIDDDDDLLTIDDPDDVSLMLVEPMMIDDFDDGC